MPIIAAVIEGVLANECEDAQRDFVRNIGHILEPTFDILEESEHGGLALRLLHRACYHCIPAAAPLVERYAKADVDEGSAPAS